MSDQQIQNTPSNPAEPLVRYRVLGVLLKIWRRLENLAFGLILLLIALYFVLQSSWVQNWLITKISGYLSEELETTVTVGHVDIAFFDNLALEQIYVADRHGDTLLFAGQLTAGLKNNFFSIFSNKLEFNEITLANARINLKKYEGEYDFNYQFIVDYFSGNKPKTPKKSSPFSLKIRNLRLDDVVLIQDNKVRGQKMVCTIPRCNAQINNLDVPSNFADIETIEISGLRFNYEERPGVPLPPRAVPVNVVAPVPDTVVNRVKKPFRVSIANFKFDEGSFFMDRFQKSPARTVPDSVLDFNHIAVRNIGFETDSLEFDTDWNFIAALKRFTATEQSGLTIREASARQLIINDKLTALYGSVVKTGHTSIGDTIMLQYDRYRDFYNFNNAIALDVRLKPGSYVELGELSHFSTALFNNKFLTTNKSLRAEIQGLIKGKINRLDGRGISAKVGKSTWLEFDFDGDDLTKGRDIMRMEFDFKRAQSDIASLRSIIPGFKPPANFERLGAFTFVGTYNLLFGSNHILKGSVNSDIGYGEIDMELDLTPGRDNAKYSGQLNMHAFDLGTFTGDKNLGKSTFHFVIKEGSHGLKLSSMEANVEGAIDTLDFKGYRYYGIKLDGTVSQSLFEGKINAGDPNLNFSFDGTVNLKKDIPEYKFTADIKNIDLKRLKLISQDVSISAKVDQVVLTGKTLADLAGVALLRQVRIKQTLGDGVLNHQIDSIRFESNFQAQDFRHFAIRSDIATVNVDGRFNLSRAPRNLLALFSKYYPEFAAQLHLAPYNDSLNIKDLYRYGLIIKNSKALTKLIDTQLDTIVGLAINGQVDGVNGITELRAEIPVIKYGATEIRKSVFNWRSERDVAGMVIQLPDTKLSKSFKLSPVLFTGNIKRDQVKFALQTKDTVSIIQSVDLKGVITVVDSLWQIKFNASKFDLFNQHWAIEEDNYLRLGKEYIDTKNFELLNGLRRIWLDSQNDGRGLKLTCSNFDLNFVNEIVPTRGMTYRGTMSDFDIVVEDVFKMQNIKVFLSTDTVFINNQPYGRIDGNIDLASLKAPLEWRIVSRDYSFHLGVEGAWHFGGSTSPEYTSAYVPRPLKPGEIYAKIEGMNFPMNILQQFVPGISETQGRFDINNVVEGKIAGKNTEIGLDGEALIREGQFKINYLNTPFFIRNQKVILTDDRIWAGDVKGDTIYDVTRSNMAIVKGGLRHNLFKKWRIECEVFSLGNNFVLLNTSKTDNSLYYGKGVGSFRAQFGGTFSRTDIRIDATTGATTKLYIPLTSESEAKEVNFINFKPKQDFIPLTPTPLKQKRRFTAADLKGMNIEMNLTMTDQAEVQLIFDEKAGDILSGRGDGVISMLIKREGDFEMYGDYNIRRGEYLFTLPVIFVNKPFSVANGGHISWYGDPYGAQIDLDATYTETTPVYNLIQEEIAIVGTANTALVQEANKSTQVNVNMRLYGDLFKPSIDFGLSFPNVSGQIKSFTDNKLRLLSQDQNEINRQVFGLIVFGAFLPPNEFAPQSGAVSSAAVSTVTQFLGSQLSNYLTSIASEFFGNSVSSFDFDIAYKDNSSTLDLTNPNLFTNRDVQVRFRSGFANDRITIQIGSQFGVANNSTNPNQSGFQGEDVVIEIQPLENRQWRMRAYQRTEPDIIGGNGLRQRYGFGLSFSREFNSFGEVMDGVKGWLKKKN